MAPVTDQVNVRVPPEAKDIILRLARRLREDTAFAGQLERFLDELTDTGVSPALTERVERLEKRLESLLAERGVPIPPRTTPPLSDEPTMFPMDDAPNTMRPDAGWTIGEGKGRRLTPSGEAELFRRIEAGENDGRIADAMGIRTNTVANRRKGLADPREG